ncbi:MAG: 3-dehydroquinate synthase II [Nitrospirae bacterium]|nr:MAG: 3-dehydroquinate synthase II [Nitrospirota bacterium]
MLESSEKKVWVEIIPWNKEIATTAIEAGVDGIIVEEGDKEKVKELGVVTVISPDGDLKMEEDVVEVEIKSQDDEDKIVSLSKSKIVVVNTPDWTIIPLENLIARADNIFTRVKSLDEAKTAFGILEKGVSGVVVNTSNINEVREIISLIKNSKVEIPLKTAKIKDIKPVGIGDRICVDTCSMLSIGEGMLVGNSSSAMFLIHSESVENPYVEPRPFRVNAGAVHAYIKIPGNRTRYLSELRAGDEVLLVNYRGEARNAVVGRIKMEKRPLLFIRALCEDREINTIVQNAETIRLTTPNGEPISVVKLREGDEVLVATESTGRHFGYKVEESIEEH